MTRGAIFWMLMILLFLGMIGVLWYPGLHVVPGVVTFVLLALLGWQVFGPAVKG